MPRQTTRRSATTKAKADVVKKQVEVNAVDDVTVEPETKPIVNKIEKKHFEPEDMIACRSIIPGGVYMEGIKSKMLYEFNGYGDEVDVEYRDLVAAVNSKSSFLFNPFIVVLDDEFISDQPKLKAFYDSMYSLEDIEGILNYDSSDIEKILPQLPNGARESLKSIAATKIANGTLDSVAKIKVLDEFFNTQLMLLTDLYE